MARVVEDAKITTPNSRRDNCPGEGPHWRAVSPGVHVGYRRAAKGGKWVARWYLGNGKYRQGAIGVADDNGLEADGLRVLTYQQAAKQAAKAASEGFADAKAQANGPIQTVRTAIETYAVERDKVERHLRNRGESARSDFYKRLRKHVLDDSPLADIPLHKLTKEDLQAWINGLDLKYVTKRRTMADLKTALYATGLLDREMVRTGLDVTRDVTELDDDEDTNRVTFTDEQIRQIIAVSRDFGEDMHRLIVMLAATGMRLSQVARMRVSDVDVHTRIVSIPNSRKGRNPKPGREHRRISAEILELLNPLLDREPGELLLTKDGGRRWESIFIAKPFKKMLKKAGLPSRATPYSFRHSSICRMIENGTPAMVVAKRHNTSVAIIESHYAKELAKRNIERDDELLELAL